MAIIAAVLSAAPSRAASVAGNSASVGSRLGQLSVTNPGGDLVISTDDGGLDAAAVNEAISRIPEGLGLPAGASLSDVIQAIYNKTSGWVLPGSFAPPTFDGGSISVSGSTLTIDIPAGSITPQINGVLASVIAAIVGVVAYAIAWSVCIGFFSPAAVAGGGFVLPLCTSVGTFFWTMGGILTKDVLTGVPLTLEIWKQALTNALVAALGFGIFVWSSPWLLQVLPGMANRAGTAIWNGIRSIGTWIGDTYTQVADTVRGWFSSGAAETAGDAAQAAEANGLATPVATGTVTSGIPGKCMDAYGSSGGADNGQLVAINDCNGNPAQNWTTFSNNNIAVWGRCLDITGAGTTSGTPVQLWECNGAPGQVWEQVGGSIVNPATGLCLDDPGDTSTNGTSLQVWTCNGSQAQQWTLPANQPPSNGSSCDLYGHYGTPCVAAYSTTRALYSGYNGPLYQVRRASDGATANIGLLSTGSYANASQQDSFCAGTTCTITEIYDQSPNGNNLTIEGAGGAAGADHGADAAALPITVNGNKAYGVDIEPGTGYRNNSTGGIAVNGQPEGMYMVASGTHVNSGCCFDFGNVETNTMDNGAGHMDAVNLTTWCGFPPCTGSGPWVQADLENGQYMGNGSNPNNLGNSTSFVTAMLKNDGQTTFALKGADATSSGLSTWYEGALPSGYAPMHQEGGIVMGTGGDNSNSDVGSFFEGVMTRGYPSDAADNAVQANIVAAGYAGNSGNPPSGSGSGVASTAPTTGETPSAAGPAVVHTTGANGAGYSSVFTVDASNGDLQETYLSNIGNVWATHDLSANFGTPPVKAGTQPVAVFHCGYTSVYTVDASSGDLQETYLSTIGAPWGTQNLSANYGTPPTNVTPTAVVHYSGASGCGWTSVYTVDASNGDLQETYLSNAGFPGDPWVTQNLSAKYGTPAALAGTSPVAIVHCGFTSVYTVDANHQLQETYLSAIGAPWGTQSLSANYGTPLTTTTPTAVVHGQGATAANSCGWTSVYTVDASNGDLEESYLSDIGFPGDPWQTQDLSARFGTPPVLAGTQPAALVHMGYTSVYTVDQGSDQLQETYLPGVGFPGDPWGTQSLSANYGTPPTVSTPVVLLHPDASGNLDWTSVYTVDSVNAYQTDLQETYLSNVGFPGDPWVTQDLSAKYGTPPVFVPFSQ